MLLCTVCGARALAHTMPGQAIIEEAKWRRKVRLGTWSCRRDQMVGGC
jgi:hypothetical protein